LSGFLNKEGKGISESPVSAAHLAELIGLIDQSVISSKIAKTVFEKMAKGEGAPKAIVEKEGLVQVTDTGAIEKVIQEAMDANVKVVEEYRSGKEAVLGFLVGQVMKLSKGKANPALVNQLLVKKLKG
jgi:aspartyl-tRNA(Asn)/glutamyl-tRNA(Gln) amidotransferase subunit B